MKNKRNKLGQEEMFGFVLIIVIVVVILMVFLGFALKKPNQNNVKSYEIESFIQSMLQYSTECGDYLNNHFSMQKLIIGCYEQKTCSNGQNPCDILESELGNILENTWKIENGSEIKAYELKIISGEQEIIEPIKDGEITSNSRGSLQSLGKHSIEVLFTVYS